MDAIAFHAAGVSNAVAPLGTSFTEQQAALLKRYASTVITSYSIHYTKLYDGYSRAISVPTSVTWAGS